DVLSKAGKVGDDVTLWIHTHVREDVLDLYGFLDRKELEFFEMLLNVSGIGRKTAEKIVIELRDKIGEEKTGSNLQGELDALEALKSLGYSQNEAREALKKVSAEVSTNAKIREALKILGGK